MKARVNTHAIRQTRFESARLGVLTTLVHPLPREGAYAGVVHQGGARVGRFRVRVVADAERRQLDVDLAVLDPKRRLPHAGALRSERTLAPDGYLVLYASEGPGGYHVTLEGPGAGNDAKTAILYDSRELPAEELFVITPIRPGLYDVTAEGVKGMARLTVSYPAPARQRYLPPEPARFRVTRQGIEPAEVTIGPGQGAIFVIEAPGTALSVMLREPDDGPDGAGKERPGRRWRNPRQGKAAR